MPRGLRRYHESGHVALHNFRLFIDASPASVAKKIYDLFPECLERMRQRFDMCVYAGVVMPEHVDLLLSEQLAGHSRVPRPTISWLGGDFDFHLRGREYR